MAVDTATVQFRALADGTDLVGAVTHLASTLAVAGERLLIRAHDAGQARTLDEALWQLDTFIPHCLADDVDHEAAWVVIAAPGQREPARASILNLRADIVIAPQASVIVELIPADEAGKQAARSRWRAYLSRGLKPQMLAAG